MGTLQRFLAGSPTKTIFGRERQEEHLVSPATSTRRRRGTRSAHVATAVQRLFVLLDEGYFAGRHRRDLLVDQGDRVEDAAATITAKTAQGLRRRNKQHEPSPLDGMQRLFAGPPATAKVVRGRGFGVRGRKLA